MLSAMHIEREFEQSSFKQLSFDKFYHLLTFLSNNFPSDNLLGRIFVAQFSVFQYSWNRSSLVPNPYAVHMSNFHPIKSVVIDLFLPTTSSISVHASHRARNVYLDSGGNSTYNYFIYYFIYLYIYIFIYTLYILYYLAILHTGLFT